MSNLSDWPGLDPAKLPQHVAVIMDGNGRWAKKRLLPHTSGHAAGVDSLKEMVRNCGDLGIPYLTAYAFSTENWKRPEDEVGFLWKLFAEVLAREVKELNQNGVRIQFIGDRTPFGDKLLDIINDSEAKTAHNRKLTLNIAINYGGRQEILQAVQRIVKDGVQEIDAETFSRYLYTAGQPDPDLMIRTSGEMRISNYLLWQMAYAEIHVTDTLWPDFRQPDFHQALLAFQNRNRRFGGRP
jgi:undecaprenyl diphosphate synthase